MKPGFVRGCSFCGKPVNKVKKLIGTPKGRPPAYICDECVAVCNSILDQDTRPTGQNTHYRVGTGQELHKQKWLDRVKSWWKYGMIGKATLPDNV
jgi:ATP-dependent protease Clp ATPase subunit